jgi:hypothetical protein
MNPQDLGKKEGLIFGGPFGVKLFHHDMMAVSDDW